MEFRLKCEQLGFIKPFIFFYSKKNETKNAAALVCLAKLDPLRLKC